MSANLYVKSGLIIVIFPLFTCFEFVALLILFGFFFGAIVNIESIADVNAEIW